MKSIIVAVILSISVYAGELDRIEAIVSDIENLREDYNKCIKELDVKNINNIVPKSNNLKIELRKKDERIKKYKKLLDKEIMKNTILLAKIKKLSKSSISSKNIALNSDKSNKKYKKLLEKKYSKNIKTKENRIKSLENKLKQESKEKALDIIEKQIISKASTFRIVTDSDIYNSINGDILFQWQKGRSFTSNITTQNWIKITGYFTDKKWKRASKELWMKKTNTVKR